MGRVLKTYVTPLGFFELAVAAPSMKAALEAWNSKSNLFHQGFAKETREPAVIAATMAKPGVVLRRPVGSIGKFKEHAELPENLPVEKSQPARAGKRKAEDKPTQRLDERAALKASLAFEQEQKRRDDKRRKEEAARKKDHEKREQAIAGAEAALRKAEEGHERRTAVIERDRAALDRRSDLEETRWKKELTELQADLRKAGE